VTLIVAFPDFSLSFFYTNLRYSVGWYTARSFALVASCTVLAVLLWETMMLYARLASAVILQRHERDNRLMSVNAATAAIAHEIKQPLTAISTRCGAALRWLKRMPPDLEKVGDSLTAMARETDRANEIIESIRELFKATPHQTTMIEINRLVQQAR
jgi:signal transduction histidine kinase